MAERIGSIEYSTNKKKGVACECESESWLRWLVQQPADFAHDLDNSQPLMDDVPWPGSARWFFSLLI